MNIFDDKGNCRFFVQYVGGASIFVGKQGTCFPIMDISTPRADTIFPAGQSEA
jgi:hypothetical protein